ALLFLGELGARGSEGPLRPLLLVARAVDEGAVDVGRQLADAAYGQVRQALPQPGERLGEARDLGTRRARRRPLARRHFVEDDGARPDERVEHGARRDLPFAL